MFHVKHFDVSIEKTEKIIKNICKKEKKFEDKKLIILKKVK